MWKYGNVEMNNSRISLAYEIPYFMMGSSYNVFTGIGILHFHISIFPH